MLDFVLSLLYPRRCVRCSKSGAFICDDCFAGISFLEFQICSVCQKGSIDGLTHPKCKTALSLDGLLSAISYKGVVKKLLYQFKYPPYLSSLKVELGKLFYEGLIQQELFARFTENPSVIIVAVPLHASRLRKRGYNQSELLAKELSAKTGISYSSNLLVRSAITIPQFRLKKDQRKKNMLGAFSINPKVKNVAKRKVVVLVDDIVTTGATLKECAKVLKKGGAVKVLGVTLAHEDQKNA